MMRCTMMLATLPLLAACASAPAPATPAPAQEAATAAKLPGPGPLRPYNMPAVEEFRLANGMRVVVVRQDAMPLVAARLLVDAGAAYEPTDDAGLAALTAALLAEGTRTRDGAAVAEAMERLGTALQTGANHDAAFVSFTSLKAVLPEALRIAASTLMEPTFPAGEFERVRDQAISAYLQSHATVEGLAAETFNRVVYAADAPYARPARGTAESLRRLTHEDVVNWHRSTYGPARTTLLLVGAVTTEEARELAQSTFDGWNATTETPRYNPSRVAPAPATRVILIDRPGSVQSALRIGQGTIGAGASDFFTMTALSHVLGGGFNSRINQNLRERRGWTYGAFADFLPRRGTGSLIITTTVQTPATDSAVAESVREYRQLADVMIPAQELAAAINNVAGAFPASVLTVQGLSQRMETVLLYGLPLDFHATYRERLTAVTPGDAARAARAHLAPDALTIVVAGDLARIEQPIRALELGEVTVVDASGERIR